MSKQLIDLATEVADSREAELPLKLLKLRGKPLENQPLEERTISDFEN